jgi:uncharacterized MAPEG superfamily protein
MIQLQMQSLAAYHQTLLVMACAGLLLVVQLIVADLTAIKHRHKAGYPIPADSGQFLFRAARAHANTNESIAAFALLALAGMFLAASAPWLNGLALLWFASRVGHMGFYYANRKPMRSLSFGVSLLALIGMFVAALLA